MSITAHVSKVKQTKVTIAREIGLHLFIMDSIISSSEEGRICYLHVVTIQIIYEYKKIKPLC